MMHPVIEQSQNVRIVEQNIQNPHGVQVQSGRTIEVSPGGSLTASWFAIPWQGFGTLVVEGPNTMTIFTTRSMNGFDYLILDGRINEKLRIGNEHHWQNLEFHVDINTNGRPMFTPGNLQDFSGLQKALVDVGRWLLVRWFSSMQNQPKQ